MAKKVIHQVEPTKSAEAVASNDGHPLPGGSPLPEYDLVNDIVFDPPLSPEEKRRRYGLGMSMEERLELARRQLAAGDDGF